MHTYIHGTHNARSTLDGTSNSTTNEIVGSLTYEGDLSPNECISDLDLCADDEVCVCLDTARVVNVGV
jgi:hypothetical protein